MLQGRSIEFILNNFYSTTFIPFVGFEGIFNSVKSALYIALIDSYSKSVDIPIYRLFNTDLRSLPVYVSGGSVGMDANQIYEDAENQINKGFTNYKLRVGLESEFKKDIERIERSLEVFKISETVAIDFIQGTLASNFETIDLQKRINELNDYSLLWIEEPVEPDRVYKLLDLKEKSSNKLATGEAYSSIIPFYYLLEKDLIDIAQYDVSHTGSFEECLKLSDKIMEHGKDQVLHVWGSYASLYSNAIFNLINPNIRLLEYPSLEFELSKNIDRAGHEIKNGFFNFKEDFLGIGVEITDTTINSFPYIKGSAYKLPK
jgi:L-alanine-DL-glutamate epimerase-like enolase superfamily enzyme